MNQLSNKFLLNILMCLLVFIFLVSLFFAHKIGFNKGLNAFCGDKLIVLDNKGLYSCMTQEEFDKESNIPIIENADKFFEIKGVSP